MRITHKYRVNDNEPVEIKTEYGIAERGQRLPSFYFCLKAGSGAIYQVNEKERSVSLMSKKAQFNNRAFMHKIIPYRYCYQEAGMIETENGVYTRTYKISPPDEAEKGSYHSKMTRMQMENILQKLAEKFTFEFTIRNCRMDKGEYLSKVMIQEKGSEDAYHHLRKLYN